MTFAGYSFAMIAVFFYGLLPTLTKKFQIDIPPFAFITINCIVLGVISFFMSLFLNRDFSYTALPIRSLWWLFVLGIVNLLGFLFYLKALQSISATNYQLLFMLSPIIVAISSYFIFKEHIDLRQIMGFLIMCAGLCLAIWPKENLVP